MVSSSATPVGTSANVFHFIALSGYPYLTTTENSARIKFSSAATLSRFSINLSANSWTSGGTIRLRKNGANVNGTITIAAGQTGKIEDLTNTDSVVADDYFYAQINPPATGTISIRNLSIVLDYPSGTTTKFATSGALALSAASQVHNVAISGRNDIAQATESGVQVPVRTAGNFKNLTVHCNANARTTTTNVRFRKNGANGNQVVAVTAGQTGLITDTTNEDSVVADDLVNIQTTLGLNTGSFDTRGYSVSFATTDNKGMFAVSYNGAVTVLEPVTTYACVGGALIFNTTEANAQLGCGFDQTLSQMCIRIITNAIAGATLRLRKNGANGNQVINIATNQTGILKDITNNDVVVATDNINYQLITNATTNTVNMTISGISMVSLVSGGAPTPVTCTPVAKTITNKFITKVP